MKDRDSEAAGCDSFFVGKLVAQEGEEDVPEDDGCKTAVAKEEAGQSTQEEDVLHLVVPPGKGLELECQHGNLSYQEEAEKQHEEEEEDCVEAQGCEERMLPKYEGAPEECVRWCGKAYELGALTSVEIEFGEPYGREGCHEECRVRQELAAGHQHLWAMDLVEEVDLFRWGKIPPETLP